MTNPIDRMVHFVLRCQSESLQRGALPMWTVFDRPRDKPDSIVVRKFEVSKGESIVTDHMLEAFANEGGLAALRAVLERAGLVCLPRKPEDQPQIVETWI